MTRVLVRLSGAGRERVYVAALCAVIMAAAGTTALIRAQPAAAAELAAWQVDARNGLNAAEQGLNADLAVAADDIRGTMAEGATPSPAQLAEEALPPFVADAMQAKRGGHAWSLVSDDAAIGYLGATGDPRTAGSLLLRIAKPPQGHQHHHELPAAAVWLHPDAQAVAGLSDERLIAAGWRQVTSRYDASVTRDAR
jgi:uncharacterized protein DUF6162